MIQHLPTVRGFCTFVKNIWCWLPPQTGCCTSQITHLIHMFFTVWIEISQNANSQNSSSKGIQLYLFSCTYFVSTKTRSLTRDHSANSYKMLIMNIWKSNNTCMFASSLTVSRHKIKHSSYRSLSKLQEIWGGKGNQKIISF